MRMNFHLRAYKIGSSSILAILLIESDTVSFQAWKQFFFEIEMTRLSMTTVHNSYG